MFKPAVRSQSKLRMTIDGPAGSGKTYTALRFATSLAQAFGGKIALIDTERGSASKYVGEAPDGVPWQFDVLELPQFSPGKYTEAVLAAGRAGYAVLIIDSLSHAWEGVGGALEIKDRVAATSNENSFTAWRHVTPLHNRMVDSILQAPLHVITTMRSRTEYVPEVVNGKITAVRRVGLAPVQRPGMEYEFDIVCDMDWAHILRVSKSRFSAIADAVVEKPGPDFIRPVIEQLQTGAPVQQATPPEPQPMEQESNLLSLNDLLELFGADSILEANGGKFPETDKEVMEIALKLGGNNE